MKSIFILILAGFSITAAATIKSACIIDSENTDSLLLVTDLKHYFDACNAQGCMVVFDNNQMKWITTDTILMNKEMLPASTFKIINLLIALETGVIADENEIVKWPGSIDTVKYGYRPDISHDMTVKEAFVVSAGWVFIELAKKIGRENYRHYLQVCKYGNQNLTEPGFDFWNFGEFGISPVNQVGFIRNLYEGKLPFSTRNMEIVKRVMKTEQTQKYTISAKTGWTREGGINTGWWVGYVETKQGVWFFATLLLQDRKLNNPDFGSCRKKITKSIFRELGITED